VTSPKTIAVGGAAGLVAIAAASWFLVLGPQRAEADQIRADTDTIQASTELLEQQIADLEEIRDSLPERLAELEQLTEGFPRKAEIPAVLDQLRTTAEDAAVAVQALTAEPPVTVVAPEAAAATPTPTPDASSEATPAPTPEASAPADPATPADPDAAADPADEALPAGVGENLASMAVSMTVEGSYAELAAFLHAIEAAPRAYLLESAEVTGGETQEELVLTLHGSMFVVDFTGGIQLPPE
jgi:Tfp pilus assembly protein PilO